MFLMTLYVQWRWTRLATLFGTLAAFAIPILSVQSVGASGASPLQALGMLEAMQSWSVVYPVLAAGLAVLLATAAWGPDHRGRHVYALSLPLPRWRYALLKLSAGGVLLAAPVVGLWLGALLATWTIPVPEGLRAYPTALAIRFGLAAVTGYALLFAVSASTARTAGIILAVVGGVVATQLLAASVGLELHIFDVIHAHVLDEPGPLSVFTGRWMLIDV
jgi:hypothetical protein